MASLLARIANANQIVLAKLQTTLEHKLSVPLQNNISLDRLARLGAEDPDLAWPIFEALWKEITAPRRPPILYSLDDVAHVTRLTTYLTPDMYNIHAFDLIVINHFVDCLSGSTRLPNGGLILAADSASNRPLSPALDLAIKQSIATQQAGTNQPLFDSDSPYDSYDPRVLERLRNVPVTKLEGLTPEEAKTLLEYYAKSGLIREPVTQGLVTERLMLSGGGVIGELERSSVRAHA